MKDSGAMKLPLRKMQHSAGQAIILIAVMMVVLIASVGLAIDGGGMYLLFRDVQNATDAAALSAAYALCTDGDPIRQGEYSADLNGFDNADANTTVSIVNPYDGDNNLIQVEITAEKPSYFIQVVYPGPLVVTSRTVAFCNRSTTNSVVGLPDFAFRSLANPGACTAGPAWDIAGSNFIVEGDIYLPSVAGNPEVYNREDGGSEVNPSTENSESDIFGNIYIGNSSTDPFNGNHTATPGNEGNALYEDLPNAVYGTHSGYTGYGGDGTITYNWDVNVELPPFQWTMDYFRPAGSSLCTGPDCGKLEAIATGNGDVYIDVTTPWCNHGAFDHQDWGSGFPYYNSATKTWADGVYYAQCDIKTNNVNGMTGNVTFVSEDQILIQNNDHTFSAYDQHLFVSNHGSLNANSADCTAGANSNPAIHYNGNNYEFNGDAIAFKGAIRFDGNDYVLDQCMAAIGFYQNGNTDSIYRCVQTSTAPPESSFGLRE